MKKLQLRLLDISTFAYTCPGITWDGASLYLADDCQLLSTSDRRQQRSVTTRTYAVLHSYSGDEFQCRRTYM